MTKPKPSNENKTIEDDLEAEESFDLPLTERLLAYLVRAEDFLGKFAR